MSHVSPSLDVKEGSTCVEGRAGALSSPIIASMPRRVRPRASLNTRYATASFRDRVMRTVRGGDWRPFRVVEERGLKRGSSRLPSRRGAKQRVS